MRVRPGRTYERSAELAALSPRRVVQPRPPKLMGDETETAPFQAAWCSASLPQLSGDVYMCNLKTKLGHLMFCPFGIQQGSKGSLQMKPALTFDAILNKEAAVMAKANAQRAQGNAALRDPLRQMDSSRCSL